MSGIRGVKAEADTRNFYRFHKSYLTTVNSLSLEAKTLVHLSLRPKLNFLKNTNLLQGNFTKTQMKCN